MKALKIIGIVILAIAVLVAILTFVKPTDYVVERSVVVNQSSDEVMEQLGSLEVFNSWSPYSDLDTSMVVTYEGNPGEVGHKSIWKGNDKAGSGSMEITSISDDSLNITLTFIEPWESEALSGFKLEEVEEGTKVTWWMSGTMPRPFNIFMDMEKYIGNDYEKGLNSFKAHMEALESGEPSYEFAMIDLPVRHFLGHREVVNWDALEEFYSTHYSALFEGIMTQNPAYAGVGTSLTYKWNEEDMSADLAAVLPIQDSTLTLEGYDYIRLGAVKAVKTTHNGSYDDIEAAHEAIWEYITDNELKYEGPVMEVYLNNPSTVSDPSELQTEIYYPLAN